VKDRLAGAEKKTLQTQSIAVRPPIHVHPLRVVALCFGVIGLALLIPSATHAYLYALVCCMLACCLAPAWYHWQRGNLDAFETVNVIGLLYFIFFGLGAIWAVHDPIRVAYDVHLVPYMPRATLYCLLGFVALLGGYFGPWFHKKPDREFIMLPRGVRFLLIVGGLGLMGSFAEVVWHQSRWSGIVRSNMLSSLAQLSPLFLFAWSMGWLLYFSGKATPAQRRVVLWLFLPATAMLILVEFTDKSRAMTLIGVPVMALWYARRKLPWVTLLVMLLLLVFVVFPVFNTYRALDPRLGSADRMTMTMEVLKTWNGEQYLDASVGMAKRRMALINSVAVVVRDVPRWVPYAGGETLFGPTLAFFIPRVIWPNKPTLTMGRDFGEQFRVVHILDQETRIAVTVPGELFWNFDLPGILVGMALWGVALRFLYRRYSESLTLDPVLCAIHLVLLIQFVHFGGGLAAQVAGVVRTTVMFELVCWLARQAGILDYRPAR